MVKVYVSNTSFLEEEEAFQACYQKADRARQIKVDNYVKREDKKRSLAAWHILCYALEKEGITKIRMARGENGKPYLLGETMYFNLSHSGDYVACAISEEEVGMDIQKIHPKLDIVKLAKRFFPEEEFKLLEETKEEERAELFTTLWCSKESYLKYKGTGLRESFLNLKTDLKHSKFWVSDIEAPCSLAIFDWKNYKIGVCSKERFIQEPENVTF